MGKRKDRRGGGRTASYLLIGGVLLVWILGLYAYTQYTGFDPHCYEFTPNQKILRRIEILRCSLAAGTAGYIYLALLIGPPIVAGLGLLLVYFRGGDD